MANENGWGDGSVNNNIGWGQGANNAIGWGKSQIISWSGATDIDGGNTPVNTVAPAITGTAQEGQTLTCSTGTWSGSPTYTYQWKRNGSNIGSATNSTYVLVTADVSQSIKCTVTATNFVGSASADSNTVTPTSSTDADAQAFITAAVITDVTQQNAINTLVVDLKGYSIWTKMKAIYPIVGGTAAQHKFNLKDPRDLDAAFRLQFLGGWTHSSTGALPNGIDGYADTFFNQTTNFTSTSNASIGVYLRTNNTSTGADMGAGNSATANNGMLIYSSFSLVYYGCAMGNTHIAPAPSNADSRGFYSVVRNAGVQSLHKRGNITLNVSETEAVGTITNETIWVGGGTSGGYNFSSRETAFNFIGDALTQTEINNFYTAVQAFQTTLGRQV